MTRPGGNQPPRPVVCRAMTTPRRVLPALVLAVVGLTAACGSATAPSASPSPDPSSSAGPSQPAIDLPASADPGGGGSDGNTGSGVVDPGVPVDPNDPAGGGQAKLVRPQPGQANPHPVAPIRYEASVDGRHVLIKVTWYSGVEPCNVLDSVKVETSGSDIMISPVEGSGAVDVACIEIAVLKATIVDLGELAPGTWHIVDPMGSAATLGLTIT